ncbi:MAG: flagellar hook-basal body protein [Phycisphaerales bacterium]
MNYGLYTAASGALNGMHRLDVATNNLANVETNAFKRDIAITMQRQPARLEDGLFSMPSNELLERLGAGVLGAPVRTAFTPGAPEVTSNPLDVAIRGEGFFAVQRGPSSDPEHIRFTRDGRFARNADSILVTADEGLPVLDDRDQPIRLDPRQSATIGPGGEVLQGGDVVATIQVTGVADPGALEKQGKGLYRARSAGDDLRTPVEIDLIPGAVERSAVDPIREMMAVSKASSDAQRNVRMIGVFDELMGRAVNTLGRIG